MSTVSSAYGLQPVQKAGGAYNNGGYSEFPLTGGNTVAIAMGDLVAFIAGTIAPITATPTTTAGATTPVGVFMGCSYQDPILGFVNRAYLPANAVSGGLTQIKIKVADAGDYLFRVQADGPITADKLGKNAALTNFSSADVVNGVSRVKLSASSAATNAPAAAVRLVAFCTNPGNAAGDAFTDVLVRWNAGVHAYSNGTGQ